MLWVRFPSSAIVLPQRFLGLQTALVCLFVSDVFHVSLVPQRSWVHKDAYVHILRNDFCLYSHLFFFLYEQKLLQEVEHFSPPTVQCLFTSAEVLFNKHSALWLNLISRDTSDVFVLCISFAPLSLIYVFIYLYLNIFFVFLKTIIHSWSETPCWISCHCCSFYL